MNKYRHPKSSLFLMEIMVNILFFAVLVTICLQLFFKAHNLSESTSVLHHAVTTCTSIAEVYQSDHDGEKIVMTIYPDAIALNSNILIYFNENYLPCSETDCMYRAVLEHRHSPESTITFYEQESGDIIYSMTLSSYMPQTLESLEGGASDEKE